MSPNSTQCDAFSAELPLTNSRQTLYSLTVLTIDPDGIAQLATLFAPVYSLPPDVLSSLVAVSPTPALLDWLDVHDPMQHFFANDICVSTRYLVRYPHAGTAYMYDSASQLNQYLESNHA